MCRTTSLPHSVSHAGDSLFLALSVFVEDLAFVDVLPLFQFFAFFFANLPSSLPVWLLLTTKSSFTFLLLLLLLLFFLYFIFFIFSYFSSFLFLPLIKSNIVFGWGEFRKDGKHKEENREEGKSERKFSLPGPQIFSSQIKRKSLKRKCSLGTFTIMPSRIK